MFNRNFIYLNDRAGSGSEKPEESNRNNESAELPITFAEYEAKYNATRRYLEGFASGKALKDADVNKDIYQTEAQNALAKMDAIIDPEVFKITRETDKQAVLQNLSDIFNRFASESRESTALREGAGNAPEWLVQAMEPELQRDRENLDLRAESAVTHAVGRVIDMGKGDYTQTVMRNGNQEVNDLPGNGSVNLGDINDVESSIGGELSKISSVSFKDFANGSNWNIEDRGVKVKVTKEGLDDNDKPRFAVKVVEADKTEYRALAKAIEDRTNANT